MVLGIGRIFQDYYGVSIPSGAGRTNIRCPFHDDTSGDSMAVYPDTNSAYCFAGCGSFRPDTLVAKVLGISKAEARKELQQKYQLEALTPEQEAEQRKLDLLGNYVEATHSHLTEEHRQYLKDRGVTDEIINNHKIGFHPEGFDDLSEEELLELGVYRRNREGDIISDFYGNITLTCYYNGRLCYVISWNYQGIENEPKYSFLTGWPRPICGNTGEETVLVEGYFDMISCQQVGINAITCLSAEVSVRQQERLKEYQNLFILFDGDAVGQEAAKKLATAIYPAARVIEMPHGEDPNSLFQGKDLEWFGDYLQQELEECDDWLDRRLQEIEEIDDPRQAAKYTTGEIIPLLQKVSPTEQEAICSQVAQKLKPFGITKGNLMKQLKVSKHGDIASEKTNYATMLLDEVQKKVSLYIDALNTTYARFEIDNHLELHPIEGNTTRRYLQNESLNLFGKVVGQDILNQVAGQLDAKAYFQGQRIELHNRVAFHEGYIYFDLSNKQWSAIQIGPGGWQKVNTPPPLFRREEHQIPQVDPDPKGCMDPFFDLLHLEDEQKLLLKVYMIYTLIPEVPKVILYVQAEKGSGKSDATKAIRQFIDPSVIESLKEPRIEDRAVNQLLHHYVALFDNINVMHPWFVRLCCTSATGESDERRALYTDEGTKIFQFLRAIIINAINRLAISFPDFQDRMLLIAMKRIEETKRMERSEFWSRIEAIKPQVFGGMLNALSKAMAIKPNVKLEKLPRMADFATWGCAIAEALGYRQEEFLTAYYRNMESANSEMIADHPIANAIYHFMSDKTSWSGQPEELLNLLEDVAADLRIDIKQKIWPKSPSILSRRINEIKSNLLDVGILVEKDRENDSNSKRVITIKKRVLPQESSNAQMAADSNVQAPSQEEREKSDEPMEELENEPDEDLMLIENVLPSSESLIQGTL